MSVVTLESLHERRLPNGGADGAHGGDESGRRTARRGVARAARGDAAERWAVRRAVRASMAVSSSWSSVKKEEESANGPSDSLRHRVRMRTTASRPALLFPALVPAAMQPKGRWLTSWIARSEARDVWAKSRVDRLPPKPTAPVLAVPSLKLLRRQMCGLDNDAQATPTSTQESLRDARCPPAACPRTFFSQSSPFARVYCGSTCFALSHVGPPPRSRRGAAAQGARDSREVAWSTQPWLPQQGGHEPLLARHGSRCVERGEAAVLRAGVPSN